MVDFGHYSHTFDLKKVTFLHFFLSILELLTENLTFERGGGGGTQSWVKSAKIYIV